MGDWEFAKAMSRIEESFRTNVRFVNARQIRIQAVVNSYRLVYTSFVESW